MNKKRLNKIVKDTLARKHKIMILVLLIVCLFLSSFSALFYSIRAQKNYYIHYDENSNLDYRVYLKPNDYFGEYLGKDQQYIASLIDYIKANFNYSLKIDKDVSYSYYYYVDAIAEVKDANGKTLYQRTDEIVPKQEFQDPTNNAFEINKDVTLDYNFYNDLVSDFIKKYNLSYTTSDVTLKMYVGINGNCQKISSTLSDDAVISMTIPLTTQTVGIDMNYTLSNNQDKLMECQNISIINTYLFVAGIAFSLCAIILLIYLIGYSIKTRSAKTIYNHKLKNIFRDYGRYIAKVQSELNYKKFQMVLVDDFEDLFEVRNSSQSPILYAQDEERYKSAFMVPTNSGLIYIYYLAIADEEIKDKNEKETKKAKN
jgi:hypothetical protein